MRFATTLFHIFVLWLCQFVWSILGINAQHQQQNDRPSQIYRVCVRVCLTLYRAFRANIFWVENSYNLIRWRQNNRIVSACIDHPDFTFIRNFIVLTTTFFSKKKKSSIEKTDNHNNTIEIDYRIFARFANKCVDFLCVTHYQRSPLRARQQKNWNFWKIYFLLTSKSILTNEKNIERKNW